MTRTASCQCRGFRVVVEAEPDTVAICHCQICQRRTGVPLTCNAYFPKSKVRLEGEHRIYTRDCPEGRARLNAKNALRHPCGAGPQGSKTRCGGRNCIGVAALNGLVPGGRAPQPPTPHPIRPIGPGLPQKAGVSLFVATATPIGAICGRRVTHPSTSRGAGVKDRS